MMTPIKVEAHFDFTGACSSCCTRCCSDDTPLYVNKNLEIERWQHRKANSESFQRTATRVDLLIKEKLPGNGIDKDIAYELVTSRLQLELGKRPITKRDLAAIVQAIQEVHNGS